MRNYIFHSIIALFLLMAACDTEHGEPLTTIRVINGNTLKTVNGIYLQISFVKDTIMPNNADPSKAIIESTFDYNDTEETQIRFGHCWSKSNKMPTLADKFSSTRAIPDKGNFSFTSMMDSLHFLSEYYVRAYFITTNGDTAYSPAAFSFSTKHLADSWSKRDDFVTGGRKYGVSFIIGKKAYFGTGLGKINDNDSYFKDFFEYDPIADTWTQKADIGRNDGNDYERIHAVGIGSGEYGYIGTGETKDGNLLQDFWKYTPATNRWSAIETGLEKQGFYTPRTKAIGFAINGKIYVGLGEYGEGGSRTAHSDIYELNESETSWLPKTSFYGGARKNASVFVANSKAYVYGGTTNDGKLMNDLYEFSQIGGGQGNWLQKADMPDDGREFPVTFSIKGSGYVCLGRKSNGMITRDNWKYKAISNEWEKQKDFKFDGREGAIGFAIGIRGFVGLGHDGGKYMNDFWEYLPDEPNLINE